MQRSMLNRKVPILAQLISMLVSPLQNQRHNAPRQMSLQHIKGFDFYRRILFPIVHVKMRCSVIIEIHSDSNAKKNLW